MRINTNMAALNAWRSMSSNQSNLQKSLSRLSSGYRINTAADDAAGLAVSEKMRAQIRGLNMATRNTQDAVSLTQTAEGGASKIQDMLQRMRELAVQSGSDTLQNTDRSALQEEFSALQSEIDRTATSVTFNGRALLDGTSGDQGAVTAGTGITGLTVNNLASSMSTRTVTVSNVVAATQEKQISVVALGAGGGGGGYQTGVALNAAGNFNANLNGATISFLQNGVTVQVSFDAIDPITGVAVKADTGAQFVTYVNNKAAAAGLTFQLANAGASAATNFSITSGATGAAANVTVNETGFGGAATFGLTTAGGGGRVVGANATLDFTDNLVGGGPVVPSGNYTVANNTITGTGLYTGIAFSLNGTTGGTFSITRNSLTFQVGANSGETIVASIGNLTSTNLGVNSLSISSKSTATSALSALDTALTNVSTSRAKMGAMQNRLDNAVTSLQTQSENLTAAESRIRDVDMAQEMAQFTKYQVLSQASTAMLAQANQLSQGILSLLR